MKIQSLSVVVPAKKCINDCKFCVSKMHESEYENMMSDKNLYYDLYKKDYINRLQFARDNECNTVMLTGDCEPLQNYSFLAKFGDLNQTLQSPFKIIEIQTVGNLLDRDMLYFLRHHVGVTTISLSVSDLWNYKNNAAIIGCKPFDIDKLTKDIKVYGFNLRLSLNMLDHMISNVVHTPHNMFKRAKSLGADQVTLRKMYGNSWTKEGKWVIKNQLTDERWITVNALIDKLPVIDKLEFGREKRVIDNMSIVVDNDCMGMVVDEVAKYLILRPNAKLYSRWDTKASLIF